MPGSCVRLDPGAQASACHVARSFGKAFKMWAKESVRKVDEGPSKFVDSNSLAAPGAKSCPFVEVSQRAPSPRPVLQSWC